MSDESKPTSNSPELPTEVLEAFKYQVEIEKVREEAGVDLLGTLSTQMGGMFQILQDNLKIDGEKKRAEIDLLKAETAGILEENETKRIHNSEIRRHDKQNSSIDIATLLVGAILMLIIVITTFKTLFDSGFTPETIVKLYHVGILLLILVLIFAARNLSWTENLSKLMSSWKKKE
jgi:hypothetical protein